MVHENILGITYSDLVAVVVIVWRLRDGVSVVVVDDADVFGQLAKQVDNLLLDQVDGHGEEGQAHQDVDAREDQLGLAVLGVGVQRWAGHKVAEAWKKKEIRSLHISSSFLFLDGRVVQQLTWCIVRFPSHLVGNLVYMVFLKKNVLLEKRKKEILKY